MSQKAEILQKLREEGERGVSGKWFYEHFQGRGVARIWDLRHKDGHRIDDFPDPKDPKYKIYVLRNVGVDAERPESSSREARSLGGNSPLSIDSGAAASSSLLAPASEARARTIPSAYNDVWVDEAA